jgi:hypothetical protein
MLQGGLPSRKKSRAATMFVITFRNHVEGEL